MDTYKRGPERFFVCVNVDCWLELPDEENARLEALPVGIRLIKDGNDQNPK